MPLRNPGGTLRYIDVWSSREQCDRAFEERIHPAVGAVLREHGRGRTDEPKRTEVDVVALTLGPSGGV